MENSIDYHSEIRHSYLGGFSILLLEGFFWLLAGVIGDLVSYKVGVLIILVSGVLFYPLDQLVQIIFKRPKVSRENPLNVLFTQISLIIPFSLPIVFMVTLENTNLFFPALTIIVGAHYLPFIYTYRLKTYWILATLLVIGGCLFGFIIAERFDYCAFYTGSLLILFAFVNRYLVKRELSAK